MKILGKWRPTTSGTYTYCCPWSEIHQDETLPSESKHLQLSFVPVDKRLEETALKGALTFLHYLQPEYLLPMHLSGGTELPRELANTLRQPGHPNTVQVLELTEPGQNISLVCQFST